MPEEEPLLFPGLKKALDAAGIKYRLFEVSDEHGLLTQNIEFDPWIGDAIVRWAENKGYAGMSLAEYLRKMGAQNG